MDLKDLTLLTEADFKLLDRCLEAFPSVHKADSGYSLSDILITCISTAGKEKIEAKLRDQAVKAKQTQEELHENCRELQGRLIQLKRLLATEGALKAAEEILNRATK